MTSDKEFQPKWFSAPGETIADLLNEKNLPLRKFAQEIGNTQKYANDLLKGRVAIDTEIARRLEKILGVSAAFWIVRESQYRKYFARFQSTEHGVVHKEWLREIPMNDMTKFGWLGATQTLADKVAACLSYFDVPDIEAWHEKYSDVLSAVAFRTSLTFDSHSGAVLAWLRQGEIRSTEIDCKPWNAIRFANVLSDVRLLTRNKDPNYFLPELQKLCGKCGVAVVIVRAPNGCRASGATRFLSPHTALIQLSFRYLSDDQFWFTFFHEAGHILLHSKKALFLEDDSEATSEEEDEANKFAADTLISPKLQSTLSHLSLNTRDVLKFAKLAGVSPGIVVGQLQHMGRVPPNRMNKFKRRFNWREINT